MVWQEKLANLPSSDKNSHFGYVKDRLLHDQGELMSLAVDICLLRITDYFILATDNIQELMVGAVSCCLGFVLHVDSGDVPCAEQC